jgi:hypothetical protein
MSNFQDGKKTTYVHEKKSSTVLFYFFHIRKAFLEGTSKSSTAFFTVYQYETCRYRCITYLVPLNPPKQSFSMFKSLETKGITLDKD